MSKVELEWNNDGFKEILNCSELDNVCYDAARTIASTANAGVEKGNPYEAEHWHSNMKGGRTAALVTANVFGDRIEAKYKTLSKAVSSCRES